MKEKKDKRSYYTEKQIREDMDEIKGLNIPTQLIPFCEELNSRHERKLKRIAKKDKKG